MGPLSCLLAVAEAGTFNARIMVEGECPNFNVALCKTSEPSNTCESLKNSRPLLLFRH